MKVKVCGLTRLEDARMAARMGASYLGAVLAPGSPRQITAAHAGALREAGGRPLVLVVVDPKREAVIAAAREARAHAIQFHGAESPELLEQVAGEGEWEVWKAFRVRDPSELPEELERYSAVADAVLLDGWHPKAHGGTGSRFDWTVAAELRHRFPPHLPLFVAGGLTAENVGSALEVLRPDGVDVSSGVESSPGVKDPDLMTKFMAAAGAPGAAALPQGR